MNIYSSIKKSYKGKVYNVDAKTNKLLKGVNSIICKDSGAELYPEQVGTYQLYGNKKIIFSKEEMNKIKFLEEPGMKLMGFKSIDSIKPYYNVRESYFIYPNELFSNGAGKLVDALIKQMANKKKCAIVKFVAREGSVVKFCALLPQLEKYDEDYFQTPPGFNLIVLPWADDIRSNSDILSKNPKVLPKVSEEQSELAKKLIKKMNISFDCRAFENFELQKFYATLQALALEESNIEPIEDTLQPHTEGLEKVLNGLDEEFRQSIFGNSGGKTSEVCEKYVKGNRNKKTRSRSKSNDSKSSKSSGKKRGGRKKKKDVDISDEDEKEEQGANYSDEIIKKMMKNKKLEKMTVPELKDICRIRNISTKGLKKVDILEKIKNYLEDE
jgi:ATP-dependent DNA helicase 2 subunit 1